MTEEKDKLLNNFPYNMSTEEAINDGILLYLEKSKNSLQQKLDIILPKQKELIIAIDELNNEIKGIQSAIERRHAELDINNM